MNTDDIYSVMERDAMIETIRSLEEDRDALLIAARMALQQFESAYNKDLRGWNMKILMERLRKAIERIEGSAWTSNLPPS